MTLSRTVFVLLPGVLALGVLCLPFTAGYYPVDAFVERGDDAVRFIPYGWVNAYLAGAALLATSIIGWSCPASVDGLELGT